MSNNRIIPKSNKHLPEHIFKGEDGKYHFLYKIINTVNSKTYYGIHSTDNYLDSYSGSGSFCIKALLKYGAGNFHMFILKFFNSRNELLTAESKIVNEDIIKNRNNYNVALGGHQGSLGVKICKDVANGQTVICNNDNDPRWLSGELVGITKGKILARTQSGEPVLIDQNDPRWLSGELVGITKGKILVKHYKNGNIINIDKDDPKYLNEYFPIAQGRCHIYKNEQELFVFKSDLQKYIDDGWRMGSPKSGSTKGKIRVYKDEKIKHIDRSDLQKYIDDGWDKKNPNKSLVGKIVVVKNGTRKYINKNELSAYESDGWRSNKYSSDS